MNTIDVDKIGNGCVEWAKKTFGDEFVFRKYQKETCVDVIFEFLSGNKNYILEAPTGSGKSITAMIIGGVLSEYYGKTGYVLVSDLSLIEQYERDIETYLDDSWGLIKGKDNYTCIKNTMPFILGECQQKEKFGYDYNYIRNRYDCASICPYFAAQQRALRSKMTVCTYHLWFTYQNMNREDKLFGMRDFIICDEAHKLVDIIQSIFSIKISNLERNYIDSITKYLPDGEQFLGVCLQSAIDRLFSTKENKILLSESLDKAKDSFNNFANATSSNLKDIQERVPSSKLRAFMYAYSWVRDAADSIELFINSIKDNLNNMVVSYNKIKDDEILTLNSLDEDYLMKKYFYPYFRNCLYMSATICDPDIYANNCNMKSYVCNVVSSTFDFSRSPICYCPTYDMSYAHKYESIPHVADMCTAICRFNPNSRGCILTSSYDIMDRIYERLPLDVKPRVLLYKNSKDKRDVISKFKFTEGAILIGPSLFDGLSFDDDLCRFLIITKVPYLDMSNEFIKEKLKTNYMWYYSQASLSIIQGVGRGVRNEHDWCYSYILDGGFGKLYKTTRSMYGNHISSRMMTIDENFNIKAYNII